MTNLTLATIEPEATVALDVYQVAHPSHDLTEHTLGYCSDQNDFDFYCLWSPECEEEGHPNRLHCSCLLYVRDTGWISWRQHVAWIKSWRLAGV